MKNSLVFLKLLFIQIQCLFFLMEASAQCVPCGNVTTIDVDLSSNADTTWTHSSTRNGHCCGQSGNTRCIRFNVKVHPQSNEVAFNVANPAPPGGAFYQLNCGPQTSLGTPLCVTELDSFCIVFCKSGGDSPNYTISASRTFNASADLTVRQGCSGMLTVDGLIESSINWNSVYPGASGAYNSWLTCTSGCDTSMVNVPASPAVVPPYIDFEVFGTATGCATGISRDTVRMHFVPGIDVSINPTNPVICTGTETLLTVNHTGGNPPYSYMWSNGETTQSITSSAGNYTVSVSDNTLNCPPAVDSVTVIQSELPSLPVLGSNSPVCAGETINLTATADSGATYHWIGSNGFTSTEQNPSITNVSASEAGIYSLFTTVNGCNSDVETINVDVITHTDIPAAFNNGPLCAGETITLSASGVPEAVYQWLGPNGFLQTGSSIDINNINETQAGLYTVTAIVNGCPGFTDSTLVEVFSIPSNPIANNNGPLCAGEEIILSASGIATASYSWTGPNGFTGNGETISISNANSTHAGIYSVTATVNGCTSPAETTTITINEIPAIPDVVTNSPVCAGNTITLGASGITNADYSWSGPDGFLATGETPFITNGYFSNEGTYFVTATVNGCESQANSTDVVVNPIPNAPLASDTTICADETAILVANASGSTIEWFSQATGGTALGSGATFTSPLLHSTTTYYVQTTVDNCPSSRTPVQVSVLPLPNAPTASGLTICEGLSATLTATAPGGNYEWFDAAIGGNLLATDATFTTPDLSETTVYYVQTTIDECVGDRTAVTVEVIPTDNHTFNYASSTYCISGANAIPNISGGFTGNFSASPSGLIFVDATTGEINTAGSDLNTYTITFLTDGPCPAYSDAIITITAAPDATFSYETPFCQFDHNPLPVFPLGASAGSFSATPAGLAFLNTSTGEIDLQNSLPGNYTITNSIVAANGCASTSATFDINIDPITVVNAGSDITICAGTSATLSGAVSGSVNSGTWSGGNGVFSPNENTLNATYTPSATEIANGYVNLILASDIPSGSCEPASDTVNISITPIPDAPLASDTTICAGETAMLVANASGGNYSWYSETNNLLYTGSIFITSVLTENTTYYVTSTVSGCEGSATPVTVEVTPLDNAAFSYASNEFCLTGNNAIPNISGGFPGVFTFTPSGLNLVNDTTGEINFSGSLVDTYEVTYNTSGACPNTSTQTISVISEPVATFTYESPLCQGGINALPSFPTGSSASAFSAIPAGLIFENASTGSIDLTNSTPGTYSIINYIAPAFGCAAATDTFTITIFPEPTVSAGTNQTICAGLDVQLNGSFGGSASSASWSGNGIFYPSETDMNAIYIPSVDEISAGYAKLALTASNSVSQCSATDSLIITINLDDADFSYPSGYVCFSATNPIPNVNSGLPGVFSSSPGGLVFTDSVSGEINLSQSALGTYTITFTSAGDCPNTSNQEITIFSAPDATFSYDSPYCASDFNPVPIMDSGAVKGVFSSSPSGLDFVNSATGEINLLSSNPGTYTITNFISAADGCIAATADYEIVIQAIATVDAGSNQAICMGEYVLLSGTIGGSATSANWSGGTGVFDNSSDLNTTYTPSADELINGYVKLFLTTNDPLGPCVAVIDSILITIYPEATVNAGTELHICEGQNASLSGTIGGSATGGIWSGGTGTFSSTTDLNTMYIPGNADIDAGQVTLTLTTTGSCDSESHEVTIFIEPATTVFAGNNQTVCEGMEVQLSGTVGGSVLTGSWSTVGDGVFSNPDSLHTLYIPGTNDYSTGSVILTLTTDQPTGSCFANSSQLVITFEKDDASFTYGSGSFCFEGANPVAIVTSNVSGIFSGSGVEFISQSSGQIDVTATPIGSYIVTFTSDGACPDTAQVNINITDSPDASFSYSGIFCQNDVNVMPEFGIGASAGIFTVSPSTGLSIDSITGEINLSDSEAGIYQIVNTIAASGGCIEVSESFEVEILPIDYANAGLDIIVCEGTTSTLLDGSISGSNTVATWSTLGDGFFADSSDLQSSYTLGTNDIADGMVTIVLQTSNTNSCATTSDTVTISYQQLLEVFAGADTTVCAINNGIQLSGLINGGNVSNLWSTIGGDGIFDFEDSLNTLYTPGSADIINESVYLVLSAAHSCSSVSDTMKVTIIPAHAVNAGDDITLCEGDSILLNGSYSHAGGALWHSNGTGVFSPNDSTMSVQYLPSPIDIAGGSVLIYLTSIDTGFCTPITDTLTLTFGSNPSAAFFVHDTICENDEILFTTTDTTGITDWQWNFFNSETYSDDSVTYTFVNAGTFDVTLEVTNEFGCKDTFTKVLVINELPQADFETIISCTEKGVQFNNQSSGDSIYAFSWNFGDNNSSADENPFHHYSADGDYSVTLEITSVNGCVSSETSEIKLATTLIADFEYSVNCSNYSVTLNDASIVYDENILEWKWHFGDKNTATEQNPVHYFEAEGEYTITLIVTSEQGCTDTVSQTVNIKSPPLADIEISEGPYYIGNSITFRGNTSEADSWEWDLGDYSYASGQEVTHTYYQSGIYKISLLVSNEEGCTDTAMVEINVIEKTDETITQSPVAIPNGFSPNGSGKNDVLYVRGGPFSQLEFRVYNEWGNLIFNTNDQQTGWDGLFRGAPQPAGVYVFILTGRLENGEIVRMSGDVTLIR